MKRLYISILYVFIFVVGYGQRCENKDLCNKELLGDYNYQNYSNYAQITSGDTLRVKVVVYSGKEYRVFICTERKLKNTHFKIIYPEKILQHDVDVILKKSIPVHKKDKEGNFVYDENGNQIIIETKYVNDTIWRNDLKTFESVVYDSRGAEYPYWDVSIQNTRLIIVEAIVPVEKKIITGCIQIMVGQRTKSNKIY